MIIRIIAVQKQHCATIYATEDGCQMTEKELFECALQAHTEDFIVRKAVIDNFEYVTIGDKEYYFPWLCSLIANYNFSDEEFNDLWNFISEEEE